MAIRPYHSSVFTLDPSPVKDASSLCPFSYEEKGE